MNRETIEKLLRQRPFVPFDLHMSNGDTHRVVHPEVAALGKATLFVVHPESDTFEILSLLHINRIGPLQTA